MNTFVIVYLGSDNDIFFPRNLQVASDVLFYGSYQPLQGSEYIVRAAKLLPEIRFKLIGDRFDKDRVLKLTKKLKLKNVKFLKWTSIKKLSEGINKSNILLGIFFKFSKVAGCYSK